jgi:hypothetical protein
MRYDIGSVVTIPNHPEYIGYIVDYNKRSGIYSILWKSPIQNERPTDGYGENTLTGEEDFDPSKHYFMVKTGKKYTIEECF